MGSTYVFEQLSSSLFLSITTFDFDLMLGSVFTFLGPNGLFFGRPGNNGVSRYPSYQKSFGLTENFDLTYRYDNTKMLCPMVFLRMSFYFSVKMSYSTT